MNHLTERLLFIAGAAITSVIAFPNPEKQPKVVSPPLKKKKKTVKAVNNTVVEAGESEEPKESIKKDDTGNTGKNKKPVSKIDEEKDEE